MQRSTINNQFESLYQTKDLSDIVFVVNGQEIRAHKIILAVKSSVFLAMFNNNFLEKTQGKIEINDVKLEVMNKMLEFCYIDKIIDVNEFESELLAVEDK